MQRAAELILKLLETQNGGSFRSPELIAEDERLMVDLQNSSLSESCLDNAVFAED